jgi:hypothetical protein
MNYKILAVSAVIGIGVIAVGLMEATTPAPNRAPDRMAAIDSDAPESQFGFMEAMEQPSPLALFDTESAAPEEPAAANSATAELGSLTMPAGEIPVGLPQIAYVYSYGYRLPGANIPALQQRHADLCESKGPQTCRIIAMEQSGSDREDSVGEFSSGMLILAVASSQARDFGKQLASAAERAEGEQVAAAISGEDLSKQIVDTEARLRARTLLRDRLMEVLATRRGTVAELVEAERGVAQVNEEIDQARSWLSEMKGRVTFSRLEIAYESSQAPAGGFMSPVRGAFGSLGSIFGVLAAVLIVLASVGLPLLAGGLGARALWRRYGLRPTPVEA